MPKVDIMQYYWKGTPCPARVNHLKHNELKKWVMTNYSMENVKYYKSQLDIMENIMRKWCKGNHSRTNRCDALNENQENMWCKNVIFLIENKIIENDDMYGYCSMYTRDDGQMCVKPEGVSTEEFIMRKVIALIEMGKNPTEIQEWMSKMKHEELHQDDVD